LLFESVQACSFLLLPKESFASYFRKNKIFPGSRKNEMPSKEFYAKHRERLLAEKKEKKEWLKHYAKHREEVKEKARLRYYKNKGIEAPPRKDKTEVPNVAEVIEHVEPMEDSSEPVVAVVSRSGIDDKAKRLAELIAELRELVPEVVKPKRRKHRTFIDGKPLPLIEKPK
jgi:hypothetical protein